MPVSAVGLTQKPFTRPPGRTLWADRGKAAFACSCLRSGFRAAQNNRLGMAYVRVRAE